MTRSSSSTTGSQAILPMVAPTTAMCPAPELVAAAASGQEDGVRLHAIGCPVCGPMLLDHEAMAALGQALGAHTVLPTDRRRSLAASVLARAEAQDDAQRAAGGTVQRSDGDMLNVRSSAAGEPDASVETREILLIDPLGDIHLAARKPRWQRLRYWQRPLLVGVSAAAVILVVVLAVGGVTRAPAPTASIAPRATVAPPRHHVADGNSLPSVGPSPTVGRHVGEASVLPVGQASFQVRGTGVDQQIVVDDGEIQITGVTGAAMAVVGSNLMIRSNGARLNAVASHGVVTSVAVFAGSVEILVPGQRSVVVSDGQTWVWEAPDAPEPAASSSPAAPAAHAATGKSSSKASALVSASSKASSNDGVAPAHASIARTSTVLAVAALPQPVAPTEPSEPGAASPFETGFAAMRAGQWRVAVTAFSKVIDDPAVGEDATYWCATALAKIGDAELSRDMYGRYLEHFGSGNRAGEVHVALGRLFFVSDRAKARLHFDAAARDPDPTVRAAAVIEIDRLRKQMLRDDAAGSAAAE